MTYIIRPNGDTNLSNATIHPDTGKPQTISGLAAGTYEIGRIAWNATPVTVAAAVIPVPAVVTAPSISGIGKIGSGQIGVAATWSIVPDQVESRWTRDAAAIAGATGTSYSPVPGDDGGTLRFEQRVQKTGGAWSTWAASSPLTMTHVAPAEAGALAPRSVTQSSGVQTYDVSGGFTGQALSFALVTPPAGVTISATGAVSIDTAATGVLSGVAVTVRATNSGGAATSSFALTVAAAVIPVPGVFVRPTYSNTPSMAEIERVYTDRRLTRPDWWVDGTTPRQIGVDTLPAGMTYNGSDQITVSGTVDDFSGWDLPEGVRITMSAGATITNFIGNRLRETPLASRVDRLSAVGDRSALLEMTAANTTIVNFRHNWFVGRGQFSGAAAVKAVPQNDTSCPEITNAEFNSFEGFSQDGVKGIHTPNWRHNYLDTPCQLQSDAQAWVAGTYNRGDIVWGGSGAFLRMCNADGTTVSPDFSAKLAAQPSGWVVLDPHSDMLNHKGTPNADNVVLGNFFNRRSAYRRFRSRQQARGVNRALWATPDNNSGKLNGSIIARRNVFTLDSDELNTTTPAITFGASHAGAVHQVVDNWYDGTAGTNDLTDATASASILISGNTAGWAFPTAASISAISASLVGESLSYGFTADSYGWMRVVVYSASTTKTGRELHEAVVGTDNCLAILEIDADPNTPMQDSISIPGIGGSQTVYVHALFQRGGGTDTQQAQLSRTNATASLTITDFSRDRTLFDVGAAAGLPGATVPLSGTATANAVIEARTVDETGGNPSAWTTVATARSAGTWSGTLTVPRQPYWMRPEVRLAASPATAATTTNRFGAGHLIALWQQSEDARMCDKVFSLTTPSPIADPEAVQMFWHNRTQGGAAGVQHMFVTDVAVVDRDVASLAALAAALITAAPGHKFGIVHHTQSGTDPREVANDANTKRNWADDAALHSYVVADGAEMGLASHSWFAAPGSLHDHYAEALVPFFLGVHLDGSKVSTPTTLTYGGGAGTYRMDHNLAELYTMPSRTKWLAGFGAHRFDPVENLANSTTVAADGSLQHSLRNKARATRSWRSALNDPDLATYFTAPVPAILSYETGVAAGSDWTDISHPSGQVDDGLPRRARYWALNWLRGLGISSWTMPVFDRCYREPAGAYIAVGCSAGPVTTTRRARRLPALGKTFPHWTDVVGFEINGLPAQRAEVQPNGWVYIYPNSGSLLGATLTFAEGGATGMLQKPADHVARLWMDYPIVDVGQGVVEGLPVQALPDPSVMLGNASDPGLGDKTAPVLSGATDTAAGAGAYAGSVSTNEGNGTLYWVATTSIVTPSDAQVRAGRDAADRPAAHAGSQPVILAGSQTVGGTGLAAGVTHYLHFLQEDAAGNRSAVVSGDGFTTASLTVTPAPVLTAPTDTATGTTTASGTVDTSTATGTLHVVALATSGATPSATQVEAGQDAGGATVPSVSQGVTSVGTQTVALTGLAPATSYRLAFMHKDAAGSRSTVWVGDGFTTAAGATGFTTSGTGPYFADPANLGTNAGELTFEMRGERTASASGVLFYQSAARINVDVQSNGAIRFAGLRDSSNTSLLSAMSSGSGTFPDDGGIHTVVTSISLPGGWVRIWVDSKLVLDTKLSASTSGMLDPNRFLVCLATNLGGSQLAAKIEHLKVWKTATPTGDTSGLGTPYKTVSGTAATVNADPWKRGTDAT